MTATKASRTLSRLIREHKKLTRALVTGKAPAGSELRKSEMERAIRHKVGKDLLRKGLTFNPLEPAQIHPDSGFYNPYRRLDDGTYAPHETKYWMDQSPYAEQGVYENSEQVAIRRDGYRQVDRFYVAAGVTKSDLLKEIDALVKAMPAAKPKAPAAPGSTARGVPVGTVHQWHGVSFRKVSAGEWVPVHTDPKRPHPIEMDHQKRSMRINGELKARAQGLKPEPDFHQRVKAVNDKHAELSEKEAALTEREHNLRGSDLDHREAEVGDREKVAQDHQKQLEDQTKGAPLEHQHLGSEGQRQLAEKVRKRGPGEGQEVKLSKAELGHLLKTGKYALISAGKNPNHDEDKKLDDGAIKTRYGELEKDLKGEGYQYTKVAGHYGGEEDSFLVMVHEADKVHIQDLGRKFNQDSVIMSDGGKHEMVYTTGANAGMKHTGQGFQEKADAEDYYSEMPHEDGTKTKFSLNFDFDKMHQHDGMQKTKGDGDRPLNHMGPPPAENAAFVKPGKELSPEDVHAFVKHFESDFQKMGDMADDLKKAGAAKFGARLKDAGSLTDKMKTRLKDRSLNSVSDVIGARAICHSIEAQMAVHEHIQQNNDVVESQDLVTNPRKDGYRAIHMLFRTPSGKIAEMQIKTPRQHIWSSFSRDALYREQTGKAGKTAGGVKDDPEVHKFMKASSDYLHELDKGGEDDAAKRPKEPKSLLDAGIKFPWDKVEKAGLEKSEGPVKFYLVIRDAKKKVSGCKEFNSFKEAKAERDGMGDSGSHSPIGQAHSKAEFLDTFSEYQPDSATGKPTKKG